MVSKDDRSLIRFQQEKARLRRAQRVDGNKTDPKGGKQDKKDGNGK